MLPNWEDIQYEKLASENAALIGSWALALRGREILPPQTALRGTARYLVTVLGTPTGIPRRAGGGSGVARRGGYWRESAADAGKAPPRHFPGARGGRGHGGRRAGRASVTLRDPATPRRGTEGSRPRAGDGLRARSRSGPRHRAEAGAAPVPVDPSRRSPSGWWTRTRSRGTSGTGSPPIDVARFALDNLLAPGETALRDVLPEARPMGILANPRRPLLANTRMARALLRLAALGAGEEYRERAPRHPRDLRGRPDVVRGRGHRARAGRGGGLRAAASHPDRWPARSQADRGAPARGPRRGRAVVGCGRGTVQRHAGGGPRMARRFGAGGAPRAARRRGESHARARHPKKEPS